MMSETLSYRTNIFSGPTVYDRAHIGHASTYVRLDILQRILRRHFNVNLVTCMNITNIDDKIIRKSLETGKDWKQIADEFEAEFWEDLTNLNVQHPDIKLRVTDKIPEIIRFIENIEKLGFAKQNVGDGSVYFKTSSYKNYGKLQNIALEDPTLAEFALWKSAKPDEPYWDTKWGRGRPGWHIECSTLASLVFGKHLDFHAGGIDLRFPHHENEEAQSCVYHKVDDWVQNWIHTGHLHLTGQSEKMSKSLKNTVSIRELLEDHSCDQFRVACLLSHYRSSIEFGPELMTAADAVLKKLESFCDDTTAYINGLKPAGVIDESLLMEKFLKCQTDVDNELRDDFNTSKALGHLMELMSVTNKMVNSTENDKTSSCSEKGLVIGVANYVNDTFSSFGVGATKNTSESSSDHRIEQIIESVINVRSEIRLRAKELKSKELFQVCDELRDNLKNNGIELKDHGIMSSWKSK